jgi:hypothetical protein
MALLRVPASARRREERDRPGPPPPRPPRRSGCPLTGLRHTTTRRPSRPAADPPGGPPMPGPHGRRPTKVPDTILPPPGYGHPTTDRCPRPSARRPGRAGGTPSRLPPSCVPPLGTFRDRFGTDATRAATVGVVGPARRRPGRRSRAPGVSLCSAGPSPGSGPAGVAPPTAYNDVIGRFVPMPPPSRARSPGPGRHRVRRPGPPRAHPPAAARVRGPEPASERTSQTGDPVATPAMAAGPADPAQETDDVNDDASGGGQ